MTGNTVVLLTPLAGAGRDRLVAIFAPHATVRVVETREELDAVPVDDATTLLSFGSGVIVPAALLDRLARPAYNLHAASPDLPGRDSHHHAIYRGVKTYGATLHVMTAKVDAGSIVAVETFPVGAEATPADLLAQANEAGFRLLERLGPALLDTKPLPALKNVSWGETKTSRADLQTMSRISPLAGEEEFRRRYRAFDGGTHDNLTVELHGHIFRIDKTARTGGVSAAAFADFTEAGFRTLVRALKSGGYRFAGFGDAGKDRHAIWRHDVDFSMHRAVRLAEIEADEGVSATYFVNPHCTFYNPFEPEIVRLLERLQALGHEIGLHFDTEAYPVRDWTKASLLPAVARERALVEGLIGKQVRVMSWHNPGFSNLLTFDGIEIGGLLNAYAAPLRRDYVYCSDSNGYWRHEPMPAVIAAGHPRLHLLTHPAWWTPEPMSPSDRIDRVLLGRARKVRADYDAALARGGRANVTTGPSKTPKKD